MTPSALTATWRYPIPKSTRQRASTAPTASSASGSITLPLLRPTLVFVLVYTIIGSMKFFDIIYVATKGGPDNSTQIVAVYMFDLFIRQGEVHYAAAMSTVLTAIILAMSLLVIRNATRRA